jgi:hypothetical protein
MDEMKKFVLNTFAGALALTVNLALAGPLDPDCTPEKAAKGAAAKATVGVGGRCSAGEAAKDSAKRTAGIEDKGPLEKKSKDDSGLAKNAVKKAVD